MELVFEILVGHSASQDICTELGRSLLYGAFIRYGHASGEIESYVFGAGRVREYLGLSILSFSAIGARRDGIDRATGFSCVQPRRAI